MAGGVNSISVVHVHVYRESYFIMFLSKFPISGSYLKKHGYETGQVLGKKLKSLEEKWIENNFIIEKKTVEESLDKVSKN